MGDDSDVNLVWLLVLLPFGGAWYLAFYRNRDWAWKERWFPTAALATTVVAGVGTLLFQRPRPIVAVGLSVVFLAWELRNTRFCHRCGRTNLLRGNPRRRHCRECGLDLQAQPG